MKNFVQDHIIKKNGQKYIRIRRSDCSISLTREISGKCFNSLVNFSWILSNSVLHFNGNVESTNKNESFSDTNAGPSFILKLF